MLAFGLSVINQIKCSILLKLFDMRGERTTHHQERIQYTKKQLYSSTMIPNVPKTGHTHSIDTRLIRRTVGKIVFMYDSFGHIY